MSVYTRTMQKKRPCREFVEHPVYGGLGSCGNCMWGKLHHKNMVPPLEVKPKSRKNKSHHSKKQSPGRLWKMVRNNLNPVEYDDDEESIRTSRTHDQRDFVGIVEKLRRKEKLRYEIETFDKISKRRSIPRKNQESEKEIVEKKDKRSKKDKKEKKHKKEKKEKRRKDKNRKSLRKNEEIEKSRTVSNFSHGATSVQVSLKKGNSTKSPVIVVQGPEQYGKKERIQIRVGGRGRTESARVVEKEDRWLNDTTYIQKRRSHSLERHRAPRHSRRCKKHHVDDLDYYYLKKRESLALLKEADDSKRCSHRNRRSRRSEKRYSHGDYYQV